MFEHNCPKMEWSRAECLFPCASIFLLTVTALADCSSLQPTVERKGLEKQPSTLPAIQLSFWAFPLPRWRLCNLSPAGRLMELTWACLCVRACTCACLWVQGCACIAKKKKKKRMEGQDKERWSSGQEPHTDFTGSFTLMQEGKDFYEADILSCIEYAHIQQHLVCVQIPISYTNGETWNHI